MKWLVLLLSMLASEQLLAQKTSLHGRVTKSNSGFKPLSTVEVTGSYANTTRTDQNGHFRLICLRSPGDAVELKLKYLNWEVVNTEGLKPRLSNHPEQDTLQLYMSSLAEIEANRKKYYNIADKQVLEPLNKQIEVLKRQGVSNKDKIRELTEERERLKILINTLSEKYARFNFDIASEIEKKAFDLFQKGNIKEAIDVIEHTNPEKRLEDADKTIQFADSIRSLGMKAKDTAIRQMILQAEWSQLIYDWKKAAAKYEAAVKGDTTRFENVFAYATFLVNRRQYQIASTFCRMALNVASLAEDSARAFKLLGYFYQDNNEFDNAIDAYNNASRLFRAKVSADQPDFQKEYARTLLTLGTAYYDKNDYKAAEDFYRKALPSLEELEKKTPGSVTEFVAAAHINLGNLYLNREELNLSEISFHTGLQLLIQILQTKATPDKRTDSITNLSRLATCYNNFGILYRKKKNMAEARKNLETAIRINRRLAAIDASAYEPQLADSYMNLANLPKPRNSLSIKKDIGEQDSLLQLALAIYERLAASEPGVYEPRLASVHHNLGQLYIDKNNAKGVAYYQKAIAINQRLAQKDPSAFEPKLADNYRSLGIFYGAKLIQMSLLGQKTSQKTIFDSVQIAAREYINKAFDIYERHEKVNPDATEPGLAELYSFTAEMGDTTAAQKALEIYTRLAKRDPEAFEGELAEKYLQIGKSRLLHENYSTTTATALAEALQLYQQLAKKEPDVYEPSLAQAYSAISHFYSGKRLELLAKKSYDQAAMDSLNRQMLQAAEKQFQIWFRFARQNPVVYEPQLAVAYMDIAAAYSNFTSRENILTAKDAYQKALVIFKKYPDDMSAAERIKLINLMLVYLEQQLKEEKK